MSAPRPPTVALVGVTASGKSALAHELARRLGDVEIATVDSMTVYRGMDLGTAKPTPQHRAEVPYHLLDLVEASEEFTVAQFQDAARLASSEVASRGRRLLLVGGTGLYGRAVIDDLEIPGQYPEVRADLDERARHDPDALFDQLVTLDPVAASRMEATNTRRVLRALEVTLGSGRPFSSYGSGLTTYDSSAVPQVGLRVDQSEIDTRVDVRFRAMVQTGLLDEVIELSGRPGGFSRTARQAVGYRQLLDHVERGEDLEVAVDAAIAATRRLARRQRRWFERDPRVWWTTEPAEAAAKVTELLGSPSWRRGKLTA